nr:hypothetical protein [Tanacetum cinerariifolium]
MSQACGTGTSTNVKRRNVPPVGNNEDGPNYVHNEVGAKAMVVGRALQTTGMNWCSERVMDGNSNDDLNNAGEMDSGDEKIVDVFLDKGDEVIPLEGVGESVNKQFEKTNELE